MIIKTIYNKTFSNRIRNRCVVHVKSADQHVKLRNHKMILTKRVLLTLLIVTLFSTFLFSQEKNTHFTYEQLPDENNVNAQFLENYKNGILHYNKAISLFKKQDHDPTLEELSSLQKETTAEFKLALPFFENAYKIHSKDENVLKGLSGIYFALDDIENMAKYRKELDELNKK